MIDVKHEKYAIKNKTDKNEKTILVLFRPLLQSGIPKLQRYLPAWLSIGLCKPPFQKNYEMHGFINELPYKYWKYR